MTNSGQTLFSCVPHSLGDTIYWLNAGIPSQAQLTATSAKASKNVGYDTWHKRLGHPSDDVIRRAPENVENFPGIVVPSNSPPCKACAEGKMHRKPFPLSTSRAKTPFELMHTDLKEFPLSSYHKYKWYISFLDDCTSYGWISYLRKKSDATASLRQFKAAAENQHNAVIKRWRFDGGTEFEEFKTDLREAGIVLEVSLPYEHQQHGRAERFNRTIMDRAQSIRFDACLPQNWWEFCVEHAVYLYNRTPMKRLMWKTTTEALTKVKPDLSNLRVFGCAAYVYLPKEKRNNKLAAKSELMIFLGYTPGMKGYRFMRLPDNIVYHAATAVFYENTFPKCGIPAVTQLPDPSDDMGNDDADQEDPFNNNSDPIPLEDEVDIRNPPIENIPQRIDRPNSPIPEREPSPDLDYIDEPQLEQPEAPPQEEEPLGRRQRNPTRRPGNVYGNTKPTEIQKGTQRAWKKIVNEDSSKVPYVPRRSTRNQPQPVPAPETERENSDQNMENTLPNPDNVPDSALARMCRQGGKELCSFLLSKAVPTHSKLPKFYRDIARMPKEQQKEWKQACEAELEALRERNVYELVDPPKDRKIIQNRWVFAIKSDGRKKARLVAKGFSQIEGIDFDEIFSPVVRYETVWIMLALAALEGWVILALDVKTAFLYGKLDVEIYMKQPEGFVAKGQEGKVMRLLRALYGLKQASRAWWKALNDSMKKLGFTCIYSDAGIFLYIDPKTGNKVIAAVYVDDGMFLGPDRNLVQKKKSEFMKIWECRDLGEAKEFLGMSIKHLASVIKIDQIAYLKKVLKRFGMQNARPAPTPLPTGYYPTPNQGEPDPVLRSRFQSIIGSLLYLSLGTRPDIAFAVAQLSQMSANPTKDHVDKALYICRYLVGTQDYALTYNGASNQGLVAYTDSDWASNKINRRSHAGFFAMLADGIICWKSRAQKTVAHSSTEAEYMALSDCSKQCLWLINLLSEIGYSDVTPVPINVDNQGSIFNGQNPITEGRTKHIDIRYHAVRDYIEEEKVELFYIAGTDNPADMFTKNLPRTLIEKFRAKLGLEFNSPYRPLTAPSQRLRAKRGGVLNEHNE